MDVMSYTEARQNLAKTIEHVVNNHDTVIITKGKSKAVLISLEHYNSYGETQYLLKSAKNARRLRESITAIREGNVKTLSADELEMLGQ